MRKLLFLTLTALLSPALAWVPKLEEATAKNVIDSAYGRRDAVPTYLTVDLNVKDGKFVSGPESVKAFDGGEQCVADWLAAPADFSKGSRPLSVMVTGQADQLYLQAVSARDSFKNLSVAEALSEESAKTRMAEGEVRVDVAVRGLPSEKARDAYLVRLKAKDGKLVAPVRRTYVNDFEKAENGKWKGTLVYYFKPLEAGLGASDKVELLLRTEADTNCAYSVGLNLAKFQ